MVSPADKNGADINIGGIARSASSGDAVAYSSLGGFASSNSRGLMNTYRATRGGSSWATIGLNPPQDPLPSLQSVAQRFGAVSADTAFGIGTSWGSEDLGHPQMLNLWRITAADRSAELLSAPRIPLAPEPVFEATIGSQFAGASDDFSHVVFQSSRPLIADAPIDASGIDDAYLYESFAGQLRSVSVLPEDEGGAVVTGAVLGLGSASPGTSGLHYPGDYAVSADGRRIFFTTNTKTADTQRLYVREDLNPSASSTPSTLRVDASERTDPDPAGDVSSIFQAASADGSQAFFVSDEKLTDDATATADNGGFGALAGGERCHFVRCDLYRWDASAPEGHRLTDLTTADPGGAGVLATAGSARDGTSLYFVAIGDLAPGASPGEPNLYYWQSGEEVRFVATLDGTFNPASQLAGDAGVWGHGVSSQDSTGISRFRATRVTPDGRFLLLRSRARLTSYDNDGHYQLYRYDVAADQLACVSCNPNASASTGDAYLKQERPTDERPLWLSRNMVDDGSRVFFDSDEALVATDTNGKADVYEWTDGGDLHLISSGQSAGNSVFLDASASGGDVFFTTRQRLVGSDADNNIDLYDSRVGGGFPEQASLPPCEGETCKPPLSDVPGFLSPSSDSTHSADDAPPLARPRFSISRLTSGQLARLARGHAVKLTVAVSRAGRVSATMTAKIGRVRTRVASAATNAGAAGRVKLSLRLTKAARHRLGATRELAASLAVRFAGVREPKKQALKLRLGTASSSPSNHRRAAVPVVPNRNGR